MIKQTNPKLWKAPLNKFRVIMRTKSETQAGSDYPSFLDARKIADDLIGDDFVTSVVVLNHDGRVVYSRSRE